MRFTYKVPKPPAYLVEVIEYVEQNLDNPVKVALAVSTLLTDPDSYKTKHAPSSALTQFISEWLITSSDARTLTNEPDFPVSSVLMSGNWVPVWREARSAVELPSSFKYNVCISFAGKDREIAEGIARSLMSAEIPRKVFYDDFEKASLWGENLFTHLNSVYSKQSMFCVILFSHAFRQRAWTRHEVKAAQMRLLADRADYVLPVAIDSGAIPDEFASTGYWSYRPGDETVLAEALEQKIDAFIGEYYVTVDEIVEDLNQDRIATAVLDGFRLGIKARRPAEVAALTVIAMIAGADTRNVSHPNIRALLDLILHSSGVVSDLFDDEREVTVFDGNKVMREFGVNGPLVYAKQWMNHIQPYIDRWEAFQEADLKRMAEEDEEA